jgi:hypothetical protein
MATVAANDRVCHHRANTVSGKYRLLQIGDDGYLKRLVGVHRESIGHELWQNFLMEDRHLGLQVGIELWHHRDGCRRFVCLTMELYFVKRWNRLSGRLEGIERREPLSADLAEVALLLLILTHRAEKHESTVGDAIPASQTA